MVAGMLYFLFGWERTEFAMAILSGIFSRLLARPSAFGFFQDPFPLGPESQPRADVITLEEIDGGQETVRRELDLQGQ